MKSSDPLKRKKALVPGKPLGWGKKRKPLKARSQKRQAQYKDTYIPAMVAFLEANPWCQVKECDRHSETVHHMKKRNGKRLDDQEFWMATCCLCNGRMEDDPSWAFANGYKLHVNRKSATHPQLGIDAGQIPSPLADSTNGLASPGTAPDTPTPDEE